MKYKYFGIYQMVNNEELKAIAVTKFEKELTYEELEKQADIFIQSKFSELVFAGVELVFVDIATSDAEYRLNYIEDKGKLIPFLDILELDFLYAFVQRYEDTYGKEFTGNTDRINEEE